MTFGVFPELEKGTGMLVFCLASWQMSVPLVISGTNREGKIGAQASQ
jgi:hypothetical protein